MLVTQGERAAGRNLFRAENPKGELGFYINSRGGGPAPLEDRAPSFVNLSICRICCPGT